MRRRNKVLLATALVGVIAIIAGASIFGYDQWSNSDLSGRFVSTDNADAVHFGLLYTSDGSSEFNDMLLRSTPMVDERPERVPGLRTKFLNDDVPADRVARLSGTLGLPDGTG